MVTGNRGKKNQLKKVKFMKKDVKVKKYGFKIYLSKRLLDGTIIAESKIAAKKHLKQVIDENILIKVY